MYICTYSQVVMIVPVRCCDGEKIDNKTITKIINLKTFSQNGVCMHLENV